MYIKVRAIVNQRKASIEVTSPHAFTIKVREKAERNMANDRIRSMLAEYFKIPVQQIRILNGHHSPSKLLVVPDEVCE